MEILIRLGKRMYKNVKHHTLTFNEIDEICDVIANGTPLPKGHGRLIDVNEIPLDCDYCDVDNAPTIIEADNESEG